MDSSCNFRAYSISEQILSSAGNSPSWFFAFLPFRKVVSRKREMFCILSVLLPSPATLSEFLKSRLLIYISMSHMTSLICYFEIFTPNAFPVPSFVKNIVVLFWQNTATVQKLDLGNKRNLSKLPKCVMLRLIEINLGFPLVDRIAGHLNLQCHFASLTGENSI